MDNYIGKLVKNRREKLGLTQAELAKRLGYKSRSCINKIEEGIQRIPIIRLRDFAKELDVPVTLFLFNCNDEELNNYVMKLYYMSPQDRKSIYDQIDIKENK